MRLKTKYRRQAFKDGGRVDDLKVDAAPETPAPEVPPLPADEPQPEPPAQEPLRQDDATLALRRQIESMRQSEQVQRQPQPVSREQRLEAWRQQGLSDAETQFFQNHPAMLDNPELTNFAVHKAREAGFERGTEGIFAAVETIFSANMNQQAAEMPQQPAPSYSHHRHRAHRGLDIAHRSPTRFQVADQAGAQHPVKVTLSPSEVEAARISGLSVEDYARQKIEYERQLSAGEYRDNREFK